MAWFRVTLSVDVEADDAYSARDVATDQYHQSDWFKDVDVTSTNEVFPCVNYSEENYCLFVVEEGAVCTYCQED